jgi:hypothetical protein
VPNVIELRRDDEAWARRHAALAARVVRGYLETGDWPQRSDLQRDLDRDFIQDEVDAAAGSLPLLPREQRPLFDQQLRLPLHILRFVPAAKELVNLSLLLIQRAGSLYLSEDDQPRLEASDPAVASTDPVLLHRAVQVLRASPPHPLGSGGDGVNGWKYEINGEVARELVEITSIDEYVERQIRICEGREFSGRGPEPAGPSRRPRLPALLRDPAAHLTGIYGLVAAIAAALIGGYFALKAAHISAPGGNGATSPAPSHSVPGTKPADVDSSWLTPANLCSWRLGGNPVPILGTNPLTLRIDDRCNDPKQADPKLDAPTSVYVAATRGSASAGRIPDGQLITVRCYRPKGDPTVDAVGNASSIWLGIAEPRGFIPDVNIGGGLTAEQLDSYGVPTC